MKNKSKKKAISRVEPTKKLNPFEIHINRSKHQVLGRKLKSDQGLPGISKNKALQKRKKSLLQEYNMKDKMNLFIDQRIGENNSLMTEDDRIMARFAAERMRAFNKKQIFNLSDSEVLTHKGQALSEVERFEDVRSDDDDDDENDQHRNGHLKGKFVANAHFGGGMLKKSNQDRESLIDQLIEESKKRKAERQRDKEDTLEATEELDREWKTIGNIVTSNSKEENNCEPNEKHKSDNYDMVMRRLKLEPQAKATQRVKTDEEIAKEEKEELDRLEGQRIKQLREVEIWQSGSDNRHRSADDLDDRPQYHAEDMEEVGSSSDEEPDRPQVEGAEEDERTNREDIEEEEENDSEGGSSSESEDSEGEDPMEDLSDLMPPPPIPVAGKEDGRRASRGQDVAESVEQLERPARFQHLFFSRNPKNPPDAPHLCQQILEVIKGDQASCREALELGAEWSLVAFQNAARCLPGLLDVTVQDSEESVGAGVCGATWWPSAGRPTAGQGAARLLSSLPLGLRLFCCYALLQDAKRTRALYPEAISCLTSCLKTATALSNTRENNTKELRILLGNVEDKKQQPTNEQILFVACTILAGFLNIYKIYPHSKILFKSVSDIILLLKTKNQPKKLLKAITELKEALAGACGGVELCRLVRAATKPKALRQYEPSFGVVREGDRGGGGNLPADALAHRKLVRRHRHETKGALRELRRDRQFLASVKLRQTARSDEQRMKKVREIIGSAATQQGELRKLKRSK